MTSLLILTLVVTLVAGLFFLILMVRLAYNKYELLREENCSPAAENSPASGKVGVAGGEPRCGTPRSRDASNRRVGGPASWLYLDVYGKFMLEARARWQMQAGALAILLNFIVDWAIWTLFVTYVLHAVSWPTWLLLTVAAAMGFIPAFMVLLYERDYYCSDSLGAKARFWLATSCRLVLILVLSLLTAAVVDMQFFSSEIDQRIHEESVLLEAGVRVRELRKAQQRRKRSDSMDPSQIASKSPQALALMKAETKDSDLSSVITNARALLGVASANKAQQQERLSEARGRVSQLRRNLMESADGVRRYRGYQQREPENPQHGEMLRKWRSSYHTARVRLAAAEGDVRKANAAFTAALKAEQTASARLQQAIAERQQNGTTIGQLQAGTEKVRISASAEKKRLEDEAEQMMDRLGNWLQQLNNSNPKHSVLENSPPVISGVQMQAWSFRDRKYSVSQRLNVLKDLLSGRAANWLNATPEGKAILAREYNFVAPSHLDDETQRRLQEQARSLRILSAIVLGFALLIPGLIMMLKILSCRELRGYYSRNAQAAGGNREVLPLTEALATVATQERLTKKQAGMKPRWRLAFRVLGVALGSILIMSLLLL